MKISGNNPCLGTRAALSDGSAGPYVWQTYNQVNTRLTNFGSGLVGLGLATVRAWCLLTNPGNACMTACTCAQQRAFVGLFSQNKAEWVIAEQGCSAYSLVSVPLYDTLGTSAVVRTGMLRCISWDCVGVCRTGRGVLHHQPDRDDHHCGGRGQAFDRTLAWTSKAVGVPGSPRDICMYVCSHAAPGVCG